MKRFVFVLLVAAFLPAAKVHGQFNVIAALTDSLLTSSGLSQLIYYLQTGIEIVNTATSTAGMLENLGKQAQRQVQNLQNIGNIHSYKDFTEWYNRQLYLERMTEETFNNLHVTIGGKDYLLADIEGMAYGIKDTYVGYWDREFGEEQNREMWARLGMTSSNYAYVQTWKAREKELARQFLSARAIQNIEYKNDMERDKETLDEIEKDKAKSDDDSSKMGDKGINAISAEYAVHNNKKLNNIEMALASIQDWLATQSKVNGDVKFDQPPVSDDFDRVFFRPMKK